MTNKVQLCAQMADHAATQITGSYREWTAFLTTAARLYKYPYHEQLLIFAQRPDATACAEYDLWNEKMRRYVRRGSRGIALIDTTGDRPRLRYVFDISDTGERGPSASGENARRPFLWQYRPEEHRDTVAAALENRFDVSGEHGLPDQLERIAAQLAREYWEDHQRDILAIVDGSFLEGYDELNIGVQFRNAATISISYALMSRCGLDPDDYFEHEDFFSVFDFNTPAAVAALGTAVSESNQTVLRQIGIAIQNYERAKSAERSATHGEQPDLHQERGLPHPRPDAGRDAGGQAPGQVREDAPGVPEGASPRAVQHPAFERGAVPAPAGDRRDGQQPPGTDDAGAEEVGGCDGGAEGQRPDEVGGSDEHSQGAGGGNPALGADLQLTPQEPEETPAAQLSLFPSEREQIQAIQEAESVKTPSASAISQEDIDAELRRGTGTAGGKLRVHAFYQNSPSAKEAVRFLKDEYGWSGHSHTFIDGTSGFVDYRPSTGMVLRRCEPDQETRLTWNAVEKRLRTLINAGQYLTPKERAALMEQPTSVPEAPAPAEEREAPEPERPLGPSPSVREIFEHYLPIVKELVLSDAPYQNACKNSDRENAYLEGGEAVKRAVSTIEDANFLRLYYDLTGFHNNLHQRVLDETYPVLAQASPVAEQAPPNPAHDPFVPPAQARDPDAPPYKVGDTVYLEDTAYEITAVGDREVQLRDPSLAYPIFRAENREQFVDGLRQDGRNAALFTPEDAIPATENFRITDDALGVGNAREKYRRNVEAIRTLKRIEDEGRTATAAEQETLSRYVGWGGLPDAFDQDKEAWAAEYAELKGLLTPEEYASARASTLNAHYTSPTVIKAIYEAVGNLGFRSGNVLEPSCGVGNFFGLLPEGMTASKLYGVELDSISGRIAGQLYPKANITVQGFEKTSFPDGFFDVAIGNVPFGGYKVVDSRYDKHNFFIHDYFLAKTIDKVRPGGVLAFITSNGISGGTMDKKDRRAREYLAERCDLLGAIRLPNNAFAANAGTDMTTDILFLQKLDAPRQLGAEPPLWVQTDTLLEKDHTNDKGEMRRNFVTVNRYFQQHPEMVLGELKIVSGPFGPQLTCQPLPDADLADQLHEAVSHIHGQITEAELPDLGEGEEIDSSIPADPAVKNYSYVVLGPREVARLRGERRSDEMSELSASAGSKRYGVRDDDVDGEVYYRENSRMVRPELNATAKARVKGMVELRDCMRELIDLQVDEHPDEAIIRQQAKLNGLYDAFTSKYGLINSKGNALAFADDSSYYLLCSLEVLDEDGRLERKADMFTRRTIKRHEAVTSVDTASEALAVSIAEKARVDMPYMEQLSGKTEDELAGELKGVIFRLPDQAEACYVTADEYLSGNIREKLARARQAAEQAPALFRANVEALEQALPKDLDASEIDVRLGATWVDKKYIQQFMYETFRTPEYVRNKIHVNFSAFTAEWNITGKNDIPWNDIAAFTTYGTERASAYRILEDSLNLRDVRIYDTVTDPDGKERRVLNRDETEVAQQKQQAIKDAFRDWIFKDRDRRQALVRKYNDLYNSTRPREYDGRHITFGGINPEIQLREHQLNAIAHVLYGDNVLLAHEVGAGKTFEMVAAAMESKRLGLCQKSLFAVPNHLIEQWASEFLRLYPSANILVARKKDFEARNRKKFCAKIATGDYDAVIMGHSQFERLPISYERRERLLQEQIWEIKEGIDELRASGAERYSIKQLERTKRSLEARLEKLHDGTRKDDVVTFEQLGVDRLFIDEAHSYKNLFLYTKMRNVAGLSTSDAQKSSDMLLKCRYIDEMTGDRGVVFATGTPVSNSMTELYVRP